MFARTTRGQGRSNGGRLLRECRFWIDLCAHRKHQDAGRRKYFLRAVSVLYVIYGPVTCEFSSAGKHFLHLKTFVWNTYEIIN